jgi:hypothetical protein
MTSQTTLAQGYYSTLKRLSPKSYNFKANHHPYISQNVFSLEINNYKLKCNKIFSPLSPLKKKEKKKS